MSGIAGGELLARLRCTGADILGVELQLSRPLGVLRSLQGRRPPECLRLLPMLFPLCGSAHGLAALNAIECAAGWVPDTAHTAARDTIALADALAAHVWRVQIDWAELAGQAPAMPPVAQARRLTADIAVALYPDGDWCAPGGGRLDPDEANLQRARAQLQSLHQGIDLEHRLAELRTCLAIALIGADPQWLTTLQARFVALAQATDANFAWLDSRLQAAAALAPTGACRNAAETLNTNCGFGKGQAHTARGILHYEISLHQGRVLGCSLEAPIDRVFAPGGSAGQALAQLRHAQNPALAARWILAAFDPCTSVRVEIAA